MVPLVNTLPSNATPASKTLAPFRLRRHADYGRAYKASRKHFSTSMTYFFRVRDADEQPSSGPRLGLTVGRVMGKAVDRNRIKRRMREVARLHLHLLQPAVVDLVLHPRKSVATMEFSALERELAKVFTQVVGLAAAPHDQKRPDGQGPAGGPPSRRRSSAPSPRHPKAQP